MRIPDSEMSRLNVAISMLGACTWPAASVSEYGVGFYCTPSRLLPAGR